MTLQSLIISTVITVLPIGFTIPETFYKCWDVGGVFVNWKIYVCDLNDWNLDFYKYHEIAHKVYKEVLTHEQREKYLKLYQSANKLWINAFYREYSRSNVEEDFADNFALLTMGWSTNANINKRIKKIEYYIRISKWK